MILKWSYFTFVRHFSRIVELLIDLIAQLYCFRMNNPSSNTCKINPLRKRIPEHQLNKLNLLVNSLI